MDDLPLRQDAVLWALGSLCQLNRVPFDQTLVLQHFPPPYTTLTLQHAAAALGFKVGTSVADGADVCHLALPCIALLKDPASAVPDQPEADPARSLALIVKADAERIAFFTPDSQSPQTIAANDFADRFEPTVLLFAREQAEATDTDAPPASQFGFKWFIPELLKHKKIWRDVLFASLAIQLMALATPLFTQVVIDKVVVHHTMSTLVVIGIALAVFMVFTAAMTWVRQYLVLHTGNRVDAVLGTQVFEHIFKLPPRYFEHRSTGVVVARVHGVETIREFVSGAAVTLILDFPFLLIFLAIMFYYSWLLSLVALGLLSVIAALSFAVTPLLRERLNRQFLLGARNQAFVTEFVSGLETVKSLQMEPQITTRFGDYLSSYLHAGFNSRQLANTYNTVANTLEQMMTLAILCVGAWLVMTRTDFTIGMLVAFQMFASRLSGPMLRLVGLWQEFQQADIAVKRLGDIMNAPAEPYSLIPSREAGGRGEVEIRDVSFRYNEDRPYLYRDLNLTLKPGQCVALMGPSGSGKSTLAKLLQGFYQPSDGAITIDGRDTRYLSANELRQNFGVVPQETVLFSGTIYDNLILASPHATFEQVIQACRMAEIHSTIEQLPQGYQTEIGERGVGLSGGQKQRLAIARALLKRPKILIFDEATSSLDSATAEHFGRTINQLKGKITMLFIAHQLPKGLKVDEVVMLGGKAGDEEKHLGVV